MEIPGQGRIKRNTCYWLELSGAVGDFMLGFVCLFWRFLKHLEGLSRHLWDTSNNNELLKIKNNKHLAGAMNISAFIFHSSHTL